VACAALVGWHNREDFGGVQTATGIRDLAAPAANRSAAHRDLLSDDFIDVVKQQLYPTGYTMDYV
jgi:hypothetical protein